MTTHQSFEGGNLPSNSFEKKDANFQKKVEEIGKSPTLKKYFGPLTLSDVDKDRFKFMLERYGADKEVCDHLERILYFKGELERTCGMTKKAADSLVTEITERNFPKWLNEDAALMAQAKRDGFALVSKNELTLPA